MCRRPCGYSSHARMGGRGKPPARATGPRCRGDTPVFTCPIDRRLRLCARVGTQHRFVSCVVVRAWRLAFWSSAGLLLAAVRCERARRARCAGRRARAWCCPVAAAAAAAVCALWLAWRRKCVPWGVRVRWLQGARAGCEGGWGWLPVVAVGGAWHYRSGGVPAAPCSCARDVVDAAAGRRRRGRSRVPGDCFMLAVSPVARAAWRHAGRWRCWRGVGGRCRSWPQRGCRRPSRAWRRPGRG